MYPLSVTVVLASFWCELAWPDGEAGRERLLMSRDGHAWRGGGSCCLGSDSGRPGLGDRAQVFGEDPPADPAIKSSRAPVTAAS